jgi:hypothetical protein
MSPHGKKFAENVEFIGHGDTFTTLMWYSGIRVCNLKHTEQLSTICRQGIYNTVHLVYRAFRNYVIIMVDVVNDKMAHYFPIVVNSEFASDN